MSYTIYTDGACRGNPGPGSYSWIIFHDGEKYASGSAKFLRTTNNRMEMSAVVTALNAIDEEHQNVKVYSDSQLVVNVMNEEWMFSSNMDLWFRYHEVVQRKRMQVKGVKVKGHSGDIWNEWCDKKCNEILDNDDVPSGFTLNFERSEKE